MQFTRRAFMTTGAAACALTAAGIPGAAFAANKDQYGGIIAVTVTPCRQNNEVDGAAMASLAARLSKAGVNGLFLAGSTGDMPQLNLADRALLVRSARPVIDPKTKIYAGITFYSIADIIEGAKKLADCGANVGVLMTPLCFFSFSQNEIRTYYEKVADKSPLPVLLYHHVKATSPLEIDTIVKLADHPNIIGMKETGPNLPRTFEIMNRVRGKDFIVLQGNEPYSVGCFNKGINGGMFALTGVCPERVLPLWQAAQKKDEAAYDAAGKKLLELCEVFKIMPRAASFSYFTYTLKLMLKYRGWLDAAWARFPGFEPDPNYENVLTEFLKKIDFPKS